MRRQLERVSKAHPVQQVRCDPASDNAQATFKQRHKDSRRRLTTQHSSHQDLQAPGPAWHCYTSQSNHSTSHMARKCSL